MKRVVVMEKEFVNYVKNAEMARKNLAGAVVLDVTKGGMMEKFDASYPIRGVEVPGLREKSISIMGVWEGLKVFKKKGVDRSYFYDEKKLGKVRDCKSYGKLHGISIGEEVMEVDRAIEEVFKDLYKREIRKRFEIQIEGLRRVNRPIVLLDYRKEDRDLPFSCAEFLKEMIEAA